MWKPGQCVTINHKRYRVKKVGKGTCIRCALKNKEATEFPCNECCEGNLIQPLCALQRIYTLHDWGLDVDDDELEQLLEQ